MDTSETYVRMCGSAHPLQSCKYKVGFEEGDFVSTNCMVRVVGHDFINIDKRVNDGSTIFGFAMIEKGRSQECRITMDSPMLLEHRVGHYIIEYISNPIWLPRIDQLISTNFRRLLVAMKKYAASEWYSGISLEQYLLEGTMDSVYGVRWRGDCWVDR